MTNLEQQPARAERSGVDFPGGPRSGTTLAAAQDLCAKLATEARQDRVCAECGYEREYRRVWRQTYDTFVGGRVRGPDYLRGAMTLVCLGCHPEFVVNPYEADRP